MKGPLFSIFQLTITNNEEKFTTRKIFPIQPLTLGTAFLVVEKEYSTKLLWSNYIPDFKKILVPAKIYILVPAINLQTHFQRTNWYIARKT